MTFHERRSAPEKGHLQHRAQHACGYVHNCMGNISDHLGDGFLITTTGASQITSIQPSGIDTELLAIGVALTRPECVLATRSGALVDSLTFCNATL